MKIGNVKLLDWVTENCVSGIDYIRYTEIGTSKQMAVCIFKSTKHSNFVVHVGYDLEPYIDLFIKLGSFADADEAMQATDKLLLHLSKMQAFL